MPDSNNPNECSKKEGKHPLEYFIAVFLVLTFIATAIAACYTRQQWLTADDTEKKQLRAYVGLKRSEHIIMLVCPDCDIPVSAPQTGSLPRNSFQMFLKNFGTTPAFHIRLCPGLAEVTLRTDLPTDIVLSRFKECDSYGPVKGTMPTIWPTEERPYHIPLPESEVQIIRKVKARVSDAFLYARIEYDDIFKIRQKSYFCYVFVEDQKSLAGCGNQFVWDDEDGTPQK
jgi:hypothetical protein